MNDCVTTDQLLMETTTPVLNGSSYSTWRDNSSEYVSGGAEPMSGLAKCIITLLYATVIVVAIGGNVVVCCIVATQRRMHTVTNLFIASLAASDVMMASLCIPLTFIADVIVQYWPFPALLCPVALYAQVMQCSMDIRLEFFNGPTTRTTRVVLFSVLPVCDFVCLLNFVCLSVCQHDKS